MVGRNNEGNTGEGEGGTTVERSGLARADVIHETKVYTRGKWTCLQSCKTIDGTDTTKKSVDWPQHQTLWLLNYLIN